MPDHTSVVDRTSYLADVISLYLNAPDTPNDESRSDWVIASQLYSSGIPIKTVRFAFQLVFLRRHLHNLNEGISAPIRSLAYYQAVIRNLTDSELDPSYMAYIAYKYSKVCDDPTAYIQRIKESAEAPG